MNSRDGKTSDTDRLVLKIEIKTTYRAVIDISSYHILVSAMREEILKAHIKTDSLNCQLC